MTVPMVDFKATYKALYAEIQEAITRVLDRGWYILGEEGELFEQEFAQYVGSEFGVGVNTGTDAIKIALQACGVGKGDEVITVSHTAVFTSLAISDAGAVPVFVDIDPRTYTMDSSQLEAAYTPRTKAVVPVHLYGYPADMDAILMFCRTHHLVCIEDCAQAHGARYNGDRVGSLGDAGCFSFYPSKNLGAYGDAGMVVTHDRELNERMRMLRNGGQSDRYHHDLLGCNSRLDELQAAILRAKLPYLDHWTVLRQQHAAYYQEHLAEVPLILPPVSSDSILAVHHLYVVQARTREERDHLRSFLDTQGIHTQVHYPLPTHLQKAYAFRGAVKGSLPQTEHAADTILSLPLYPEMNLEQLEQVVATIHRFYEKP